MDTLGASSNLQQHTPRLFRGLAKRTTDLDVYIALRTDANVLVTGPADVALTLARQVHEQSGWRHGPFKVVDCTRADGLERSLAEALSLAVAASDTPGPRLMQAGTVLLQEIGCLPDALQALLGDQVEELRRDRRSRPRIIASSSESLLPRVLDGTFDSRLFYRLNVIHLVTSGRPAPRSNLC